MNSFAALCSRPALQGRANRTKSIEGTEPLLNCLIELISMGLVLLVQNGFTGETATKRDQFVEVTLDARSPLVRNVSSVKLKA